MIQILILTLATIFVLIFLGNHSLRPVRLNYARMASEFGLLVIMDLLLVCANSIVDTQARKMIGWTMIGILGTQIAVSQGSRLYIAIRDMIKTLKKKCCGRKKEKVSQTEERAIA